MRFIRPYPTLLVVSILVSVLTLFILTSQEAGWAALPNDGARAHTQAMRSYHIIETTEFIKLIGLTACLLLWLAHDWGKKKETWVHSSIRECASIGIFFLSFGIFLLVGAEEAFSIIHQGYESMAGNRRYELDLPVLLVNLLELTYPLGLAIVWAFKPEGQALLD